jgi:hypothetical protein
VPGDAAICENKTYTRHRGTENFRENQNGNPIVSCFSSP